MKAFFIFFLSLNAFANSDIVCLDEGKIKYLLDNKWVHEKSSYCLNKKTGYFIKRQCFREDCLAQKIIRREIPKKLQSGQFGNPTFKVCRHITGKPQIIELWNGKGWIKTSRCLFKDGSYMDTSTIYSRQDLK